MHNVCDWFFKFHNVKHGPSLIKNSLKSSNQLSTVNINKTLANLLLYNILYNTHYGVHQISFTHKTVSLKKDNLKKKKIYMFKYEQTVKLLGNHQKGQSLPIWSFFNCGFSPCSWWGKKYSMINRKNYMFLQEHTFACPLICTL